MKHGVTRRDFMKTASVAGGVTIATSFNPLSYAANEKVRVGCIGTGGQGFRNISGVAYSAICNQWNTSPL